MSLTKAVQLAFKRLAPVELAENWDNGLSCWNIYAPYDAPLNLSSKT
jgi:hypothetical protein